MAAQTWPLKLPLALNSSNFIALPEGDDVHLELVVGPDVEDTHVLGQRLALAQRRGHGAARLRDEERLQRGNLQTSALRLSW